MCCVYFIGRDIFSAASQCGTPSFTIQKCQHASRNTVTYGLRRKKYRNDKGDFRVILIQIREAAALMQSCSVCYASVLNPTFLTPSGRQIEYMLRKLRGEKKSRQKNDTVDFRIILM